jgi:hypothetical protein
MMLIEYLRPNRHAPATKKVLFSLLIGALLTWALYFQSIEPSDGPKAVTLFLVIPVQLLVSTITREKMTGEFLFYGIFVFAFSLGSYLVMRFVKGIRDCHRKQPK